MRVRIHAASLNFRDNLASAIRPVIDRTFALEDLPAAFRHQQSSDHFGKVCIAIGGA